ncbi:MAG TPA: nuclear transport factor 2 family protein [Solirubrobacter sp.]|nr:nuclear transport factor 2 family protein [Solirubrobacter sp.]
MIIDDLFAAVSEFDAEKLATILHDDVRFREMPNLINPQGSERDREAALAGLAKGRELLAQQSYDVHERVVDGDTIAARVTWRGRLANGKELTAHIATFTQTRDGKIFRHATYDCYEPLG